MSIKYMLRGVLITYALLVDGAFAQLSGPILTYAQRGDVLRAVIGVPGAAYFTPAIDTAGMQVVATSAESGYAVALNVDRTAVSILRLQGAKGTLSAPIAESSNPVKSVRLSPKGSTAAIVRSESIDIITGLPDNPRLGTSIPVDAVTAAVADDGEAVLAVDNSRGVWLIERSEKTRLPALDVQDVAFRAGSHDFLYSDAQTVTAVSGRTFTSIAGVADGISALKLARPSRDGRFTFILNGSGDEVVIHDQASGTLARTALPCAASQGEWLLDSTVSVSCAPNSSMYFVQITQNGTRLLFVPEPVE